MNQMMLSIVFAINYEVIPHKLHSGVRLETGGVAGTERKTALPPRPFSFLARNKLAFILAQAAT